ncbi:MAG: LptF/LptG family permease [Flavobacteriaceae bacterium]
MKILDRYILTTYLKTFISVFLILILIFILQTIWLYIKELAGKDLDISVIFKFLLYFMPKLMPLVLPLTILLASIMVFGSFAENYEFAAMKSTGISLQRAMSGLSVFIVILGITTFFFANNVIPWAELNSLNLRRNIAKMKPAMLLVEGQFNEVGDYNIKFAKKHGETDQYLDDVLIHVKGSDGRTNATTIKSKTGELIGKESSNILKLILKDGNYYNDIQSKNSKTRNKKPFAKSTFEEYVINIDLTKLNQVDMDEQSETDKYNMLNVAALSKTIDSLVEKQTNNQNTFAKSLEQRSNVNKIAPNKPSSLPALDSVNLGPILKSFDIEKQIQLVETAEKSIVSAQQIVKAREDSLKAPKELLNNHIISLNDKFALGVACIILFFVGAPLGALIRKGGIGLPMVIAIVLFLTYHFIGIFAINSARNGNFNPVLASWFSTLVMLPLGIYLTRRATADKGLFEFDHIIEPIKNTLNVKTGKLSTYTFLNGYKDTQLADVVNNYKTLGHDENIRFDALKLLSNKNYDANKLQALGIPIDTRYNTALKHFNNYKAHSKYAISLYGIGVVLLILFFVFRNNELPSLASSSIQLSIVSLALFVVYYILSVINLFNFNNHINKKKKLPNIAALILGIPLYFIAVIFFGFTIQEDLNQNCFDSLE